MENIKDGDRLADLGVDGGVISRKRGHEKSEHDC
jgi:hypothetical protein